MNAERNRVADLLSKRLQSAKISDAVRTTLKEMRVNASGMKALLQPAKPIFKDEIHQVSVPPLPLLEEGLIWCTDKPIYVQFAGQEGPDLHQKGLRSP